VTRFTLIDEREASVDATIEGDAFFVTHDELLHVTGWHLRPEGLCRGPICVPYRSGGDRVDLHDVADALGRAFVLSEEGGVAALAGDPMSSGVAHSIDELELPDLDGNTVRMSDFAGRKRLLIAWASW